MALACKGAAGKLKLDRVFRLFDETLRWVERLFMLAAAAFGAWLVWTVLSQTDVSLLIQLGASAAGAIICAGLLWLFLAVMALFN